MHVEEFLKLSDVRRLLSKRYRNGVNAAVARHQHARANEDTVTGALGQALVGRGFFQLGNGGIVTWSTQYTRFGSSGKIGPGADGIFEIELSDDKGITTKKSLLFNSKKQNYTFGQSSVRRQARQIAGLPGRGIVLDYRPDGFMAVDAWAVSQAVGRGSDRNHWAMCWLRSLSVAAGAVVGTFMTQTTRRSIFPSRMGRSYGTCFPLRT